mmetsp:Transcript_90635/g.132570  ORF Transcript_90635/g.132570 Transcript_90635/m.132570 type:complete len:128 (+) Transcript_90635:63-446(+)
MCACNREFLCVYLSQQKSQCQSNTTTPSSILRMDRFHSLNPLLHAQIHYPSFYAAAKGFITYQKVSSLASPKRSEFAIAANTSDSRMHDSHLCSHSSSHVTARWDCAGKIKQIASPASSSSSSSRVP